MKLNDIYKKIDSLNEANDLNEQASMNIMMNGDTADDVGVLLKMMQNAGLDKAAPASDMSDPNPRMDMEKFRNIIDKPDMDSEPKLLKLPHTDDPGIPGKDDSPCDQDVDSGIIGTLGGAAVGAASGAGPLGALVGAAAGDSLTDPDGPEEGQDYANEPDEKYGDTKLMTKDLAGGLNGPKKSYPKVAGGDNPMAIRAELTRLEGSIKEVLWKALEEKKTKPDFLDMDKDGDKKEPMKKAIKDKKGKK